MLGKACTHVSGCMRGTMVWGFRIARAGFRGGRLLGCRVRLVLEAGARM